MDEISYDVEKVNIATQNDTLTLNIMESAKEGNSLKLNNPHMSADEFLHEKITNPEHFRQIDKALTPFQKGIIDFALTKSRENTPLSQISEIKTAGYTADRGYPIYEVDFKDKNGLTHTDTLSATDLAQYYNTDVIKKVMENFPENNAIMVNDVLENGNENAKNKISEIIKSDPEIIGTIDLSDAKGDESWAKVFFKALTWKNEKEVENILTVHPDIGPLSRPAEEVPLNAEFMEGYGNGQFIRINYTQDIPDHDVDKINGYKIASNKLSETPEFLTDILSTNPEIYKGLSYDAKEAILAKNPKELAEIASRNPAICNQLSQDDWLSLDRKDRVKIQDNAFEAIKEGRGSFDSIKDITHITSEHQKEFKDLQTKSLDLTKGIGR